MPPGVYSADDVGDGPHRTQFADFLSYDPRIEDPALQTFCVRLEFDEVLATAYKYEVCKFEEEIQAIISKLKKSVEGA